MPHPTKTNLARGWHHGGALEMDLADNSNGPDDTTALARLQASRLMRGLALLPDTAAALACLVFGGRS